MSASRVKQVSQLRRQAAHVFARKAFKHVKCIWVGVFYYPYEGAHPGKTSLNIVIYYDPNYSGEEIWDLYIAGEDIWEEDLDELKLERAWDRRVRISRVFEGSLEWWWDVEALFYSETVYGDFNHPILRKLRSVYYQGMKEYQLKLNESIPLVKNLMDAERQSVGRHEASQQAYKIANILKADTVYGPLHDHLFDSPRRLADRLWEIGSHDPTWPETLQTLCRCLTKNKIDVKNIIYHFDNAGGKGGRAAKQEWKWTGPILVDRINRFIRSIL
jgi:hypothetical protein